MDTNQKISLEVSVANRSYPLKIYEKDQEKLLQIVKEINDKLNALKRQYDARDNQDYLAMLLLQINTEIHSNHSNQSQTSNNDLEESISKLERIINT
jgi:cell division protein ZapA